MSSPRCLLLLLTFILIPTPALACGGVFCSTSPQPDVPSPPAPVDQSAEQIVFLVNPDGETITAHVLISYVGSADDFAWIVPVPGVPEVEESSITLFRDLDAATRPLVQLPPAEPCATPSLTGGGDEGSSGLCDHETDDSEANPAAYEPIPAERVSAQPPVTVYTQGVTNNYSYDVVGAEDSATLITWLQDNGYNVSDNMSPVISIYNGSQSKFLAVKLREGRSSTDIVPLAMTYAATDPMIPIQLTAVAAQPLMGILVYIVADRPYAPTNMAAVDVDLDDILFNVDGATNYFEWVARVSDESDGKTWVREFTGNNPLRGRTLSGLRRPITGRTVSRFYTRMSPHHMTLDPVFQFANIPNYRADLDLSGRPSVWSCRLSNVIVDRVPSACGFNYCGSHATCTVFAAEQVGCLCDAGQTAQRMTGPDGSTHITCVPVENPFGITAEASGVGSEFDPCDSYVCEGGTCIMKSGFPTCQCGGTYAVLSGNGITCVAAHSELATFGPGAGRESRVDGTQNASLLRPQQGRRTWLGGLPSVPLALTFAYLLWAARRVRE